MLYQDRPNFRLEELATRRLSGRIGTDGRSTGGLHHSPNHKSEEATTDGQPCEIRHGRGAWESRVGRSLLNNECTDSTAQGPLNPAGFVHFAAVQNWSDETTSPPAFVANERKVP